VDTGKKAIRCFHLEEIQTGLGLARYYVLLKLSMLAHTCMHALCIQRRLPNITLAYF
jgi:hypothetical protein